MRLSWAVTIDNLFWIVGKQPIWSVGGAEVRRGSCLSTLHKGTLAASISEIAEQQATQVSQPQTDNRHDVKAGQI